MRADPAALIGLDASAPGRIMQEKRLRRMAHRLGFDVVGPVMNLPANMILLAGVIRREDVDALIVDKLDYLDLGAILPLVHEIITASPAVSYMRHSREELNIR